MNKSIFTGLLGLAFATPTLAADSINLKDVIVVANRIPQSRDSVIGDVSIITREEIERAGQSTITELLSSQPGIEMDSTGGVGSTSFIRIRGNNSQSVVVLIDGMRVTSATSGTTNFSQIALSQIDRVEILRGPASSLYGADAIGGVIQIFTQKGKNQPNATLTAGYGSNNTKDISATFSASNDTTAAYFGVNSLNSDGISSVSVNTGYDRDNDAFRNFTINGNVSHQLTEGHEIAANIYSSSGRYNTDNSNAPAFNDNAQQILSLNSKNKLTDYWQSSLTLGESKDKQYSEGASFGNSSLNTKQTQLYWQNDIKLPVGNLILAYDRIEDKVNGNVDFSEKKRTNNGYVGSYLVDHNAHTLKFGLRLDDNSQFGNYTTGNIGYGYKINSQWRTTASYGTAYRAPTFNDLYYPFSDYSVTNDPDPNNNYVYTYEGNASLKPESAKNSEISFTYDQGHHRLSATAYENKISNLIVGSNGTSTDGPANVGQARIQGLTISYEGWVENYHFRASADIQDPKNEETGKMLTRRSKQHGVIWMGAKWYGVELGSELVASGSRYDDAANQFKLDGYTLLNLTAKYKVDDSWTLNARINNVFNRHYVLATTAFSGNPDGPDFNTPGTNLFISARWVPKQ
jgi:vitamin B12 transporter